MPFFIKTGDLQRVLTEYYQSTGKRLQFQEALDRLTAQGLVSNVPPKDIHYTFFSHQHGADDFEAYCNQLIFPAFRHVEMSGEKVSEPEFFPMARDVFIFRHPRYTRPMLHSHDFVEIDFVVSGSYRLHFEDEVHEFRKGAVCLIAPGSQHDVEVTDDSTVYTFMLRRSTFQGAFFSLLTGDDALSLFFRNILQRQDEPNYLMFQLESVDFSRGLTERALLECFSIDPYANICAVSMIHLIFAAFLRDAGHSPQFYHYRMGRDFSAILHYIRYHYQTLTLTQLAEQFHYSKPHLCTLIKVNTGVSFTELIRQIRMTRAKDYLLNTDLPVLDIAEIVGYNSADHFSRVFRGTYHCSPQEYRRSNVNPDDLFVPFETK